MTINDRKLKQLQKQYDPQKIINLHIAGKITLSAKQITELIKLRDEKGRRDSNGKNKKSKTK